MKDYLKIIISLLLVSVMLVSACKTTQNQGTTQDDSTPPLPPGVDNSDDVMTGNVVEISMTAKRFEFVPNTIRVKQGDKVVLKIKSIDVTHGFFLPDFGVSADLPPNKEVVVEFVAKARGTYSFRCSNPCGEGHSKMSGTLVVE